MKLSRWTLFVQDYPAKGDYIAYNTRSQAIVVVNDDLKNILEGLGDSPINRDSPHLSEIEQNLKVLEEMGIVVEDDVDEAQSLEYWFDRMKYETAGLHVTILTTYDCNFACSYCFEEAVKKKVYLNSEVASQIVSWITNVAAKHHSHKIELVFYGGEPMLNLTAIEYISKAIGEWAKERWVKFGFNMVTNGSLLTSEAADRLLALGLLSVQITLDGDSLSHDISRPFRTGEGSFETILNNIRAIADKVKVHLNGNFNSKTDDNMLKLLDVLEDKGLKDKLASVNFSPIMARLGNNNGDGGTRLMELGGCKAFFEEELYQSNLALAKEVRKRGFKTRPATGVNVCPVVKNDTMVIIDPVGLIYKCPSFVGHPEFAVGEIGSEDLNQRHVSNMNMDLWKKCLDCPYVPMCGGGCRFSAYLRSGDTKSLACDRTYLDKVWQEYVKMDYEQEMK